MAKLTNILKNIPISQIMRNSKYYDSIRWTC